MADYFKRLFFKLNKPNLQKNTQYPPQYKKILNEAIRKTKFDIEAGNEILFKEKLGDIISGKKKAGNNDIFNRFNDKFFHEKLFVVIFTIDDYINLFKDDTGINDAQRLSSMKLIICNIFKEFIYSFGGLGYFLEIDDNYVCIVNISKSYSRMNIKKALKQTEDNINKYFGVNLKMALSSDIHGFEHLYRGYIEAVTATEYFKIDDSDTILSFADMVKDEFNTEYYSIMRSDKESFNEIFSYMNDSNSAKVKKLIFDHIKAYLNSVGISFVSFKFITYEIAINITNEFRDYITNEIYINDIFTQNIIPIVEVIKLTEHICKNIKDDKLSKKSQTDKKEVLVAEMIKYIETNYDDIDLNIAKLAEEFDYVPSYISKIFKSIKNVSLIDYINKKRIKEVKHLLINTNKTLGDIAGMTGFCTDAALIRVFKKYEGTTPVAYKKDYYKTE